MSYVLGDTGAAPFRLQNTCTGDSTYNLARSPQGSKTPAYDITLEQLLDAQPMMRGKRMTKATVQNWVKSLPNFKFMPFSASDNPGTVGADGKPEGYATFTADTQIMLPDVARLDGKVPKSGAPATSTTPTPPSTSVLVDIAAPSIFPKVLIGLGVVTLLAVALSSDEKKPKKATA